MQNSPAEVWFRERIRSFWKGMLFDVTDEGEIMVRAPAANESVTRIALEQLQRLLVSMGLSPPLLDEGEVTDEQVLQHLDATSNFFKRAFSVVFSSHIAHSPADVERARTALKQQREKIVVQWHIHFLQDWIYGHWETDILPAIRVEHRRAVLTKDKPSSGENLTPKE